MNKIEAAFQARFGRWLQYSYTGPSAAFELKRTLSQSFPLGELKDHQRIALLQAQSGLYHKISDQSFSSKPFDCFFLRDSKGYLVVAYGLRLTGFYMIDIHKLEEWRSIEASKDRGAKSLTEDLARRLGQYHELGRKLPSPSQSRNGS